MIRDTIASQPSVIVNREIYLTAAFAGAFSYVVMVEFSVPPWPAAAVGGLIAFVLRAGAIQYGWSLPGYRGSGQRVGSASTRPGQALRKTCMAAARSSIAVPVDLNSVTWS